LKLEFLISSRSLHSKEVNGRSHRK